MQVWTDRRFERFAGTDQARSNLRQSGVRAFTNVLSVSAVEFVLRVLFTAALARMIGPAHFGLFLMAAVVTSIAEQFRDLGLSTATIQRETINCAEVSNLFWLNIGAGVLMAMGAAAVAPAVSIYFNDGRLTSVITTLGMTIALSGLTVQHEALLTRQLKHGRKALVRLLAFGVSSVMAIGLAHFGAGVWALVWREVIRSALIVVGIGIVCPWLPNWFDRKTRVWGLVGFGVNLTLTYSLGVLSSCMDRVLLGRYFGAGAVGLYRQSYQLVVAPMSQFMSPLYQVALPGLSMLQNEPQRYCRVFRKIVSVVAWLSMPLSVFIAVYSRELTILILGRQWEGASTFILIFAIGGILRSVVSTIGFVLVSRGQAGMLLKLGVLQSAVMVGMMWGGLRWGPAGVAVGEGATVLVMMFPWLYYSLRGSPVPIGAFFKALARPAVASVILGCCLIAVTRSVEWNSALQSVAVGCVVAAGALIIGCMSMPGGMAEVGGLLEDLLVRFRQSPRHPFDRVLTDQ